MMQRFDLNRSIYWQATEKLFLHQNGSNKINEPTKDQKISFTQSTRLIFIDYTHQKKLKLSFHIACTQILWLPMSMRIFPFISVMQQFEDKLIIQFKPNCMIVLVALLFSVEATTQVPFSSAKSIINVPVSSMAISENLSILIVGSSVSLHSFVFYLNNGSGFQRKGKIFANSYPYNQIIGDIQLSSNGKILAAALTDGFVHIYQLVEGAYSQTQTIQSPGLYSNYSEIRLSKEGEILLIASKQNQKNSIIYSYDPVLNQYVFLNKTSLNNWRTMSPDGMYIIDYLQYTPEKPYINSLQNSSYLREIFNLPDIYSGISYSNILMGQTDQYTYPTIVSLEYYSNRRYWVLKYFQIKSGNVSEKQTIGTFFQKPDHMHLTKNGRYLTFTFSQSKIIYLYSLGSNNSSYELISTFSQSSYQGQIIEVIVGESGNFLASALNTNNIVYPTVNQYFGDITFYFQCVQTQCSSCWLSSCLRCKQGFELVQGRCVCPNNSTIINSTCQNCLIKNCLQCSSQKVCIVCGVGFQLHDGVCLCPFGNSISSITGLCVTCSVDGCLQCQVKDICSKFGYQSNGFINAAQDYSSTVAQNETDTSLVDDFLIFVVVIGASMIIWLLILIATHCWRKYQRRSRRIHNMKIYASPVSLSQSIQIIKENYSLQEQEPRKDKAEETHSQAKMEEKLLRRQRVAIEND